MKLVRLPDDVLKHIVICKRCHCSNLINLILTVNININLFTFGTKI